ncbi:Naringenin,2-oxoglutarate 3-dioxygenase [Apostasia shenzhenica]|uniref:Naringenin,2-oxoglutarate 3-dioxygenase n=1 Tax=Apostasia shenzhenica TaxID=1088818 RepID=A0A2I0A654_9ASPA|nr:Naringenin,2-oxoglutarate 3-dioxygenase [Apostasia shenzhenica]
MADQLLLSLGPRPESLPGRYVRPAPQRPRLSDVDTSASIPVIDLTAGDDPQIVAQIGSACRSNGFFQVVNHGVSSELVMKMRKIAGEFFRLSAEEKMRLYSDDVGKKVRLSTSFNVKKEEVHNWRDYLRLHCYPLEEYLPSWPQKPVAFREVVSEYCSEVRRLGFRLLGLISLSLGLEEDYILRALGEQEQHMAVNYYPPCPQPELTYGLPAHTDPNALTILLQDPHVAGLQVLRPAGKWAAVDPHPEALVINVGDQLQVLSNGRYKSVWHRAVVNSEKERVSVAFFLCPSNNAVTAPAEQLIGEKSPAMYRSFTYGEYYKKFWARNLDQEHCLDQFRSYNC